MLAAFLSACGGDADAATSEKVLALEAKAHSLEESLEALQEENATLQRELITLRQNQANYLQEQEEARIAGGSEREAADLAARQEERLDALEEGQEQQLVGLGALGEWLDVLESRLDNSETIVAQATDLEADQEERLAALQEGQARNDRRFDGLDSRLRELEEVASQLELVLPAIEKWFTDMDERVKLLEGTDIGRTLRLAETGGAQAQVINYGAAYGGARSAVLVLPDKLPEGEIPLIVSLHGFGSDSFSHSRYIPLHERVNRDGFALLLPDGVENAEGQRFWNPTDGFGKAEQDDISALTALVQEAGGEFDVGPIYFFGYSNGGFMSYWMACKGLPGLRAVASLAGTSYMDDAACDGSPPVSVLHIHSADDAVVRFDGITGETGAADKNEPGYAGAEDMFHRWGERAGCNVQSVAYGLGVDLDDDIEGPETLTYAFPEGCAEGITVEMWSSDEGGHTPGYGDAFTDALLDWLLAQQ